MSNYPFYNSEMVNILQKSNIPNKLIVGTNQTLYSIVETHNTNLYRQYLSYNKLMASGYDSWIARNINHYVLTNDKNSLYWQ